MRTKIAAIIAVVMASSLTLFGQAAAEAALTQALSSAAGSTVGHAMGGAANHLAGRMGQRVPSAASAHPDSATKKVPRKATPVQAAPAPSPLDRPLIVSIQGGEGTDTSCASAAPTPAAKPEKPNVNVRNGCSVTTSKGSDDHPSVINLPAAN